MGQFYKLGETKVRPGVYKRYTNAGSNAAVSAIYGIGAIPIKADWGPEGEVVHFTGTSIETELTKTYGSTADTNTVSAAIAFARGGAKELYVYRMKGTGGAKASCTPQEHLTITAKYNGARTLAVTIKELLSDEGWEVVVYEGTTELEKISFSESTQKALCEAVNKESEYIKAETAAEGTALAAVAQTALDGGVSPTITTEDYSSAFNALEIFKYNVLALDTLDTAVKAAACVYVDRVHEQGKHFVLVTGDESGKKISEYTEAAKAINDEKVVYFCGAYVNTSGETISGVEAIAEAAGMIAATPSNQGITHKKWSNAASLAEVYTNDEYETAIKGGVLLLSTSADGEVWFESGNNTLINPAENQDDGWKKIRRVMTRFELFDRIDRTFEPKVGRINNDADGIGDLIQSGQKVIDTMIAENKLESGEIYEDSDNPHSGDSAWFIVSVIDLDSLERIYLHYKFRYSSVS